MRLWDEADTDLKPVGDIAMNADPIHASLPWVGVCLLLEVQKDGDYLFVAL